MSSTRPLNHQRLWADLAWLPDGWQRHVMLEIDSTGRWRSVQAGVPCPADALRLNGPALPGLVNAHSHAHQRAFAGLAEHVDQPGDNFWSWRDRMYRVADSITPASLHAIATQLYGEMLEGGYTQVCEFHYLAHTADQAATEQAHALSQALVDAASAVGIGLTLLPVLYERAGFTQPALRPDQQRFHRDAEAVMVAQRHVAAQGHITLNAGVAVHSLRAARPASLHRLRALCEGQDLPIHIHVAEQTAEVDDCLQATGQRPVQWLAAQGLLDARWQLVHATHVTPEEIEATGRAGSGVVICPTTEANLGDGLTDLPGWLRAGTPLSVGSDSQVTRCWREELRWLEYGQRLQWRQRNVAMSHPPAAGATASRLWQAVLAGGAATAGQTSWGLQAGARADLLVAPATDAALAGIPTSRTLDALVFSSPGQAWSDVMVAGRWTLRDGERPGKAQQQAQFTEVMRSLWGE